MDMNKESGRIYGRMRFPAIAGVTFSELCRQPVTCLLAVVCVFFIALMPLLITHTLDHPARLIRDSALALHFVSGLFFAAYAASETLAREMRAGTASAVLCKPVSRTVFFLAKAAGSLLALTLYSVCMMFAALMTRRATADAFIVNWHATVPLLLAPALALVSGGIINFFTRRSFCGVVFGLLPLFLLVAFFFCGVQGRDIFGHSQPFAEVYEWPLLAAGFLVSLALLLLSLIASALAAWFDGATAFLGSAVIFALGLMSSWFFGGPDRGAVSAVLYAMIPDWQHYWLADALAGKQGISARYLLDVSLYTLFYSIAVLSIGLLAFRRREIR